MRSVAILLTAALASGLVFSATSILQSVRGTLDNIRNRLGADIMVVPSGHGPKGRKILLAGEPETFYMDGRNLDRIAAVRGVQKASPQLFITSAKLECCSMPTVLLVGFDPATDFTLAPWVARRFDLVKEKMDEVTIGAHTLYASERPSVKFYGKMFKYGRSLHPTGMGFLDYSIFMSMDAARDMIGKSQVLSRQPLRIAPDQISSVMVKVDRAFDVREVAAEIEKASPGVEAVTLLEVIASLRRNVESALWTALAAGAAFWALMIAATGIVFALEVNEREREVGVLRAMGATKRHVFGLIVSEASILSGVGAVMGVALGWAALVSFRNLLGVAVGIPFSWQPPLQVLAVGGLCVLLICLSGAICAALPAGRICRKEPFDAIWHGMR